jgi:hypothetical protein
MPTPKKSRLADAGRPQTAKNRLEAIRKAAETRERRRRWVTVGVVAAAAIALVAVAIVGIRAAGDPEPATSATALEAVSGVGSASPPPWALPDDPVQRVAAAGLDTGPMGTADHYHAHLDIIVDGRQVAVPADLGIDPATGAMSAVHTHTPDGIVHVEADTVGETFTLGQLFTEWNVRLTTSQLGSLSGEPLKVYVNGEVQTGDPALLNLADEQQITVVYGDQQVDIPDSYDSSGI